MYSTLLGVAGNTWGAHRHKSHLFIVGRYAGVIELFKFNTLNWTVAVGSASTVLQTAQLARVY